LKKMFLALFLIFLLGGVTIFGLNRLSNSFYDNKSSKNNNYFNSNSSNVNNDFLSESTPEGEIQDSELENQNTSGQIYFKNIEDAYKILGINEVEEIKEKSTAYIKNVLKLTDMECLVQSINLEGQKIIFNMLIKEKQFSVIKDRNTNDIIIQIEEGE